MIDSRQYERCGCVAPTRVFFVLWDWEPKGRNAGFQIGNFQSIARSRTKVGTPLARFVATKKQIKIMEKCRIYRML